MCPIEAKKYIFGKNIEYQMHGKIWTEWPPIEAQ